MALKCLIEKLDNQDQSEILQTHGSLSAFLYNGLESIATGILKRQGKEQNFKVLSQINALHSLFETGHGDLALSIIDEMPQQDKAIILMVEDSILGFCANGYSIR